MSQTLNHKPPPARARKARRTTGQRQRGVTLVELMVGLTIGLLTIVVALGTLMVSRGISGTVSDASQLQQQAAYVFRIIGQQARQAGSIKLNLAFSKDAADPVDPADLVAFEAAFDRSASTVSGNDAPAAGQAKLLLGYQNYTEPTFSPGADISFFRDCLGQQPSATVIQSGFFLLIPDGAISGDLRCAGSNGVAQSIVSGVADFQVRYLLQSSTIPPTVQYASAAGVGANWPQVFGVEVCLELVGNETIDTAGATYRPCNWATGQAETPRGNRLRMVFRNTYQIRSQGSA